MSGERRGNRLSLLTCEMPPSKSWIEHHDNDWQVHHPAGRKTLTEFLDPEHLI